MKTKLFTIALITIATIFIACNPSTRKKNETNVVVKTDTIVQGVEEPEPVKPVDYNQYPIAYVKKDGKLYFFNPEDKSIVPFREEPDSVFNCVYSDMDDRFFYSTYQNGVLTIKEFDLSNVETIKIAQLTEINITEDELYSETLGEKAQLLFYRNHLFLDHDFIWDYYSFDKLIDYSLANHTTTIIANDEFYNKYKFYPHSREKPQKNYGSIYKKTEQLELSEYEDMRDDAMKKEYIFQSSSVDGKKILFAIMLGFGDLAHGPYCVANSDGTMLKLLKDTDMSASHKPLWCNHYLIYFSQRNMGTKDDPNYITEFFYTLAETNETVYIDKDVDYYAVRKKHPVNQ